VGFRSSCSFFRVQGAMSEPQYQHLKTRLEQGILVLTITEKAVQGETLADGLRREMLAAADIHQARPIVVDFQQTEYNSSVALWPLLTLLRKIKDGGGRMILCGLSPLVGDIFYTTKLVSPDGSFAAPFGMETDVAAAVARLTKPAPDAKALENIQG